MKHIEGITTIHFDKKDIVRHKLVRDIVEAYDKHQEHVEKMKAESKAKDEKE
ncbi:MAG TPA: PhoH family protein [Draconibacterium sp.]|nr:PhoH family protein [Draconibacterium sp.]